MRGLHGKMWPSSLHQLGSVQAKALKGHVGFGVVAPVGREKVRDVGGLRQAGNVFGVLDSGIALVGR